MSDFAIELKGVTKTFYPASASLFGRNKQPIVKALDNVNLKVGRGEFVAVIGRNGSGKSTLLQVMAGSVTPDSGSVIVRGKTVRLSLGMGFNNELTARQNIQINATLLGLTFDEIAEVFDEIIEFAEVKAFVDTKIKFFSKGMRTRLAFSVALHTKADILLLDEVFGGVGDAVFRKKANTAFAKMLLQGRTVVLVSHNMNIVRRHASRVALIDQGKLLQLGQADQVLKSYRRQHADADLEDDQYLAD